MQNQNQQLTPAQQVLLAHLQAQLQTPPPSNQSGLFQESIWVLAYENKYVLSDWDVMQYLQVAMTHFNWPLFKFRIDARIRSGDMSRAEWGPRAQRVVEYIIEASENVSRGSADQWLNAQDPADRRQVLEFVFQLLTEVRRLEGL